MGGLAYRHRPTPAAPPGRTIMAAFIGPAPAIYIGPLRP